jgi:hypothetical protein
VDLATSGGGGIGPFIGICAIVAAFGVADAHVQGGMVGDMAFMCPEFMQVTLLGIPFQMFFKVFISWLFEKNLTSQHTFDFFSCSLSLLGWLHQEP